jgi:hypothetical protein
MGRVDPGEAGTRGGSGDYAVISPNRHAPAAVLPQGWTFDEAEVAAGTAKSVGAIKFDLAHKHSSLAFFALNHEGMAYSYEEAKARYGLDRVG